MSIALATLIVSTSAVGAEYTVTPIERPEGSSYLAPLSRGTFTENGDVVFNARFQER